jgi:hypothetical protein
MTAVNERMSTEVAPIPVDATLIEAARQMRVSGAGGLPCSTSRRWLRRNPHRARHRRPCSSRGP